MVLFNVSLIPHGIQWSIIRFLTHACSQVGNDLHGQVVVIESGHYDRWLVGNDLHVHVIVIESGLMVTIQRITIPHNTHWSSDVLLMG